MMIDGLKRWWHRWIVADRDMSVLLDRWDRESRGGSRCRCWLDLRSEGPEPSPFNASFCTRCHGTIDTSTKP